jgi:hypothetical protein
VLGLVPARATVAWITVEEEGGWRVRFGDSDYQPQYPSDVDAPAAARAWAEAVRGGAPARRHDGGALLGVPALGERLRGAAGSVEVGGAGALPASGDAAALVAAFGPETAGWGGSSPCGLRSRWTSSSPPSRTPGPSSACCARPVSGERPAEPSRPGAARAPWPRPSGLGSARGSPIF